MEKQNQGAYKNKKKIILKENSFYSKESGENVRCPCQRPISFCFRFKIDRLVSLSICQFNPDSFELENIFRFDLSRGGRTHNTLLSPRKELVAPEEGFTRYKMFTGSWNSTFT